MNNIVAMPPRRPAAPSPAAAAAAAAFFTADDQAQLIEDGYIIVRVRGATYTFHAEHAVEEFARLAKKIEGAGR